MDVLRSKGVPEDHILFLNLIASPEGATNFAQKFPKVRIVTAFVDQGLNEKKYVTPITASQIIRDADEKGTVTLYQDLGTLETDSILYSFSVVFQSLIMTIIASVLHRGKTSDSDFTEAPSSAQVVCSSFSPTCDSSLGPHSISFTRFFGVCDCAGRLLLDSSSLAISL